MVGHGVEEGEDFLPLEPQQYYGMVVAPFVYSQYLDKEQD